MKTKRSGKRPRRSQRNIEHLRSAIQYAVTLKSVHKREEIYPINLSNLIGRQNVGPDAQIRLIGYHLRIQIATGNNCSTVSASVGHSGPWVRPATQSDNFNQQFVDKVFNLNREVAFHKGLVRESERQYLNPDDGNNFLNLRIRDPCGVIPGATILLHFKCELIRPTIDEILVGASLPATDLYEDQDVHTSGNPTPRQDVPILIRTNASHTSWRADGIVSPITYTATDPTVRTRYTITVSGQPNLVGEFTEDTTTTDPLQKQYTDSGFAGNITKA